MVKIENRQIYSDAGRLVHRVGTDSYFTRSTTLPGDIPELFEEVDERPHTIDEAAYKAKVRELIAERYDIGDEIAIQRQRDSKPDEFDAYNEYAEDCKRRAREMLSETEPDTEAE